MKKSVEEREEVMRTSRFALSCLHVVILLTLGVLVAIIGSWFVHSAYMQ